MQSMNVARPFRECPLHCVVRLHAKLARVLGPMILLDFRRLRAEERLRPLAFLHQCTEICAWVALFRATEHRDRRKIA